MKVTLKLILSLGLLTTLCSCMKAGESGLQLKAKDNSKNQIVDVLKGKPKTELLSLKYTALNIKCSIQMKKEPKVKTPEETSLNLASTSPTPTPPSVDLPLFNTSEDALTYNIVAQAKADPQLTKQVGGLMKVSKSDLSEDSAEVSIIFDPISFSDLINEKVGNATYIMKYTPVLNYTYRYKITNGDHAVEGSGLNRLLEKIRSEIVLGAYADDNFIHKLSMACTEETTVNTSNPATKDDFATQWSCVNCVGAGPVTP
jgi:hypothetical protein